MMQILCPQCEYLNPIDYKFCRSCGASLENAKLVTEASQAKQGAPSTSREITYYSDGNVLITSTRARFGGTTYAMANITSVACLVIEPNRLLGSLVFVSSFPLLGAGVLLLAVAIAGASVAEAVDETVWGLVITAVGVIVGGLGIFLMVREKPKHLIRITSSSGESDALTSPDQELIKRIVAAMNQAISERG